MSQQLAKWGKGPRGARKPDRPQEDKLTPDEDKALKTLQREAKEQGSDLTTGGKGGLPPSTVLGVMRRDGFKCKACGEPGDMQKNGGLGVHHKSEHLNDPKAKARSALLRSQGKKDAKSNIVALCANCHDATHDRDREEFGEEGKRD